MKRVKFGDIVREVKAQVDRNNNPYLHYVAGDHMDSMDLTIRRKGSFATDDVGPAFIRIFKPGQVLYGSRRTYLKKIAVADFEGICSNTTFVLETKDSNVFLQELLPFVMLSESFTKWSISHSKGSTNPYVLFSDLANYEFTLPSLSEQKVLADKLWAAYRVKESYKKLLAATDDMLKAKFQEMFEEEGDKYSIKDLFELQMGKTPDRQNSLYWTQGKHKWFSIADMSKSEIYSKDTDEYISDLAVEKSGIKKVKKGTIFMSFKLTIGKVLIASEDVYTNEAIMAFNERYPYEAETGLRLSKKWIYYTFLYKDWLENAAQAVKGRTLNKESIGNSNIIVPKYELQQQFVEIATQAEATKESLRKSIENIDQVIKSLINQ
jgi:type I restriction enzyme S subunit